MNGLVRRTLLIEELRGRIVALSDGRTFLPRWLPNDAVLRVIDEWEASLPTSPDPDWTEDAEGYVRAPLSYENREGDPAFNGAFDKW